MITDKGHDVAALGVRNKCNTRTTSVVASKGNRFTISVVLDDLFYLLYYYGHAKHADK